MKRWHIDVILVKSLRTPFLAWIAILSLYLGSRVSDIPPAAVIWVSLMCLVLWIISITLVLARLAGRLVRYYGTNLQGALPVSTVTETLASVTVGVAGVLVLLNTLGISITPILGALGVGGLAVALALQETLANFFAGLTTSAAQQVRVGDYIRLNTGEEGYVADISWRTTALRALPNNLIFIPNSKLAQAIITNFHLPEKKMALMIPVNVSYEEDPEEVERILVDEGQKALEDLPGLVGDPPPFVRFTPGFGEWALNFTLICHVREFVDQFVVQHELRKRILRRFRQEGITIPFPTRTVYAPTRHGDQPAAIVDPDF